MNRECEQDLLQKLPRLYHSTDSSVFGTGVRGAGRVRPARRERGLLPGVSQAPDSAPGAPYGAEPDLTAAEAPTPRGAEGGGRRERKARTPHSLSAL